MGAKKTDLEQVDFYSTTIVARKTSKSTETIRREIQAGRLKARVFNGEYAIAVSDYETWLAQYFKEMK